MPTPLAREHLTELHYILPIENVDSILEHGILSNHRAQKIVHKSVAGRPQDIADIKGIVNRQRPKLDLAYVRHWLATFAEIKDDPDLGRPFEDALKAAAAAAAKRKTPR